MQIERQTPGGKWGKPEQIDLLSMLLYGDGLRSRLTPDKRRADVRVTNNGFAVTITRDEFEALRRLFDEAPAFTVTATTITKTDANA